jgi:pimeloyl-ACP methyl ester carboxylesterase
VDSIGKPVNLLGHSYGGLCAIEAALLTSNVRRLIIYEGVPLRGSDVAKPDVIRRLQAMLDADNVEAMLVAFLTEVAGASPEQVEMMRSDPNAWDARMRNAPTIPRELTVLEHYTFAPDRFARMRSPTLLMVGENSPREERESADTVARALPDARVVLLPRQQHLAMYTDPALFVREVTRFAEG